MKKNVLWILAAIMAGSLMTTAMTSCSDDDDDYSYETAETVIPDVNAAHAGTPQRTYDLDWKITNENTESVNFESQFGGILRSEFNMLTFEYNSVGPDMKTVVRLTGSICFPRNVFNKQMDPRHIMIYNQFTHAKNGEKLTESKGQESGVFVNQAQGIILISTDAYGWTLTKDKPQAYCHHELHAVEQLDCFDAAMEILKQKGCSVVTDFEDSGDHISNGIFVFCLNTMMQMEMVNENAQESQDVADIIRDLTNMLVDIQSHPEDYKELYDFFTNLK